MALKTGSFVTKIDKVTPNDWNPNEMEKTSYKKLVNNIRKTLESSGIVPPIVVRPRPEIGKYEIIDGFHRWNALQDLKQTKINVCAIEVPDKDARILTNTLNYLRGSPNREKYGKGLVELVEQGMSIANLAALLPEDEEEIEQLLEENEISLEALTQLNQQGSDDLDRMARDGEEAETWVDLKFRVSTEQAQVVEQELSRISNSLQGKNLRSRALEYMAVQSSHSILEK